MPLDTRTAVEDALWSAIEADAPTATLFTAGRRAKAANQASGWFQEYLAKTPAGLPNLKIETRGDPTPPLPPRVFGMNDTAYTSATCNVPIPQTLQIALILDVAIDRDYRPIEAALERVLWSKWPKLGLAYVSGYTMSTIRRDINVGQTRVKQITKLLTVSARPMLSQLVAP